MKTTNEQIRGYHTLYFSYCLLKSFTVCLATACIYNFFEKYNLKWSYKIALNKNRKTKLGITQRIE
jgi:hypothetical protein